MPRIANPVSTEVLLARNQLRTYLSVKGNSEVGLSRLSGVAQYTISKFLTGRIKCKRSANPILASPPVVF